MLIVVYYSCSTSIVPCRELSIYLQCYYYNLSRARTYDICAASYKEIGGYIIPPVEIVIYICKGVHICEYHTALVVVNGLSLLGIISLSHFSGWSIEV